MQTCSKHSATHPPKWVSEIEKGVINLNEKEVDKLSKLPHGAVR